MMSGPLLMRIEREVVEARVVSRPNRFTLVVDVGGKQVPCHLHDPGRLKELTKPGLRALVTKPVYRSIRKTPCDVLSIEVGGRGSWSIHASLTGCLERLFPKGSCSRGTRSLLRRCGWAGAG